MLDFKYSATVSSDLNIIKTFVEEILVKMNSVINNKDLIFDIRLIINELIINGAFHGNKCIESKCVRLSLELKDKKFFIQVEDEGDGVEFDTSDYDPMTLSCGGRGLILVNGLSDEFYIIKNKVIAVKYLN